MTGRLDELLRWFEGLRPETLCDVARFYAPDARFKDPFNELSGAKQIERLYAHMFETMVSPRFLIGARIAADRQAFITWDFDFRLRAREYRIHGSSYLLFDERDRIILHRDYWDAAEQVFQRLPVVGPPIRWLRRRFALTGLPDR